MINTVFVSSTQIAHLTRLSRWQPFPWSPVLDHLSAPQPSPADLDQLAGKGLLIADPDPRVNTAMSVALAAVCEPDLQIEIALPDAEPVFLCRAGTLTVGWHGFAEGGIALSFPLTVADRHRFLTDLLDADGESTGVRALRLTASATEVEILMSVGDHVAGRSPITTDQLVRELLETDESASPEALTDSIDALIDHGLLDAGSGQLRLGDAAVMFERRLEYGFLVKRIRVPDPTEPCVTDALHVYRNGEQMVTTRPVGGGSIECRRVNRRQLADMILTLTFDSDELAGIRA